MDEQKGIEAIIYLQSLAGITETEEQARIGWNAMSTMEKKSTLTTYDIFKKIKGTEDKLDNTPAAD